jgi:hypothetical protein
MEVPMATRTKTQPRQKRSSGASKVAPNNSVPALSYRDLAWWAETADGYRDEELVIAEVEEKGQIRRIVKQKREAQKNRDHILLDGIFTGPDDKPRRRAVSRVTVEVDGKKIECKSKDGVVCDSIFCTDSAIEKFLFPYYHSQRLLTPEQWDKLKKAFRDPFVLLIGHVWPSRAVALGQGETTDAFYILSKGLAVDDSLRWQSLGEYKRS